METPWIAFLLFRWRQLLNNERMKSGSYAFATRCKLPRLFSNLHLSAGAASSSLDCWFLAALRNLRMRVIRKRTYLNFSGLSCASFPSMLMTTSSMLSSNFEAGHIVSHACWSPNLYRGVAQAIEMRISNQHTLLKIDFVYTPAL